ncbi:Protein Jade-1, partial [Dissophora globulifera]
MSSNESSPHSAPEETDCLVCGSGKTFTHNQILFCDGPGCDIPVHQNCYGVKVVPEGNWYCQRCEDRIPPSCCCPQKSGAFKRTTIPNQYIHAACARFHPGLNHNEDPITFSSALAGKQICCICKSDYGICAPCTADSCSRVLHATCAQNESLMISGKRSKIYCDVHRDIGALSKIMKRHRRRDSQSGNSSNSGSAFHRSSKRSKSYRESSSDEDHDDDEDDYESESDDEEIVDPLAEDEDSELKDKHRRNKSTASSSASSTTGSRGHTRGNRSQDSTDRRRRDRSSDSEEIDVDETEAVLGSSAGGGGRATTQRKKIRTAQSGTKESAAESQRRRLLMTLDKSKKKQGPGGLSSLSNLTNMPIRTLGGVGPPASSPVLGGGPLGESRQKLPGISRHGYNTNSSSGADSPSNPYTA